MSKRKIILLVGLAELIAIIGALPMVCRQTVFYTSCKSFWESNPVVLIAFLVLVTGVILLYTRHQSRVAQLGIIMAIDGLLLITAALGGL